MKNFLMTLIILSTFNSYLNAQINGKELTRISLSDGVEIILYDNNRWEFSNVKSIIENKRYELEQLNLVSDYSKALRGGINANPLELEIAKELKKQNWIYIMPIPKSKAARWGNTDGRTTWWYGYWYNEQTKEYSYSIPILSSNGKYEVDPVHVGVHWRNDWRTGGTPPAPKKIEWLLSRSGGVNPEKNIYKRE